MPGVLHVVATPLGNLEDLSPRAEKALREAALIACEDTRRTGKLLARFGIEAPLVALHKFSERERLDEILEVLVAGNDVALVSDGGTPGISDPGALLVAAAHDAGVTVSPVPGPSAVATLLSASGLPADRFVFEGFLPHREGERRRRLRELAGETRPWVCYEAPHRILATLTDLDEILGPRPIVLGRELTKLHEWIRRGTPRALHEALAVEPVRGEIAIAVAGHDGLSSPVEDDALPRVWEEALAAEEGDTRAALKRTAKATGLKKPEVWRRLLERGLVRA